MQPPPSVERTSSSAANTVALSKEHTSQGGQDTKALEAEHDALVASGKAVKKALGDEVARAKEKESNIGSWITSGIGAAEQVFTGQLGGAAKTLLDQAKNDVAAQAKADSKALADAIDSKVAATNTQVAATSSRVDGVASETRMAQMKIDQNAQALEKLKGLTPEQITALLATLGVSVGGGAAVSKLGKSRAQGTVDKMQQDNASTQARLTTLETALQDSSATRERLSTVEAMLGKHASAKPYVDELYDRVDALQQQLTRISSSSGEKQG